jgi:hypothetical protein
MKDSSLWLVSSPADSDPHERLDDLRQALDNGKLGHASLVEFPQFKVSPSRHLGTRSPFSLTLPLDRYSVLPLDPLGNSLETRSVRHYCRTKDGRNYPFPHFVFSVVFLVKLFHFHFGESTNRRQVSLFPTILSPRARRRTTLPVLCIPRRF